ncbi:putative immunity protein [Kineococcus sp. TBRC 1896]|uniref:Immunity protein n=1 Tax=Kineococcus mangrovi TaxID=1660183 RepID=A0ABV4I8F9_9ACTN
MPLFEHAHPEDTRLREGISGALRFAAGQLSIGAARTLAFGCHAAARRSADEAARAVARACGHAVAVADVGGHARNVPTDVLEALRADGAPAQTSPWKTPGDDAASPRPWCPTSTRPESSPRALVPSTRPAEVESPEPGPCETT